MNATVQLILPELILTVTACVLFLLGTVASASARRAAPVIALVALLAVGAHIAYHSIVNTAAGSDLRIVLPPSFSLRISPMAAYVRLLSCCVAALLLLLSWPSNRDATGNTSLNYGEDAGEFFGLFLLSVAGLLLTCSANDLGVLFLALELTSIPTYVMVSISRPAAAAQEAGVKYFFLGALSVALMLFGFSYLFGTTGSINFDQISQQLRAQSTLTPWQLLAVLLCVIGFAFKMAAFPLHYYAGDVYEGAATPVTAFLAYVPKTAGFVALISLLYMVGGPAFELPAQITSLLWVIAALTMTVGNVLGLLQSSVKRTLAYSSIAHSGYMLVAAATLPFQPQEALRGILFYLAAYGVMNAAAFGVLILLPAQSPLSNPDEAAESFEDLAGTGRKHPFLGLCMAVACFSLIGLPLTVGFVGKYLLIQPALMAKMYWLVIVLVINAAISAAYYLRIVGTMFLRPTPSGASTPQPNADFRAPAMVRVAVVLSAAGSLALGIVPVATQYLADHAKASRHPLDQLSPEAEMPGASPSASPGAPATVR